MPIPPEKHALVAFGANQPFGELQPKDLILAAFDQIKAAFPGETRLSGLYRTPCFPAGAGPDYVNAAVVMTSRHDEPAETLLARLHDIEARFGRTRQKRWDARTLDIDLLALDAEVRPNSATQTRWRNLPPDDQARLAPTELVLPHPRLQDRAFVLVPLADVAPHWRHPLLGKTVLEMLQALPAAARAEVVRIDPAASS